MNLVFQGKTKSLASWWIPAPFGAEVFSYRIVFLAN
jgi:hypothetical protein